MRIFKLLLFAQSLGNSLHLPPQVQGKSRMQLQDVVSGFTPIVFPYPRGNPQDAAMILPFNSCHPRHCPRSIPYSQCLRLRRICSEDSVFVKRCQELKVKLQRRGYPGSLIDAAMRKVSD
ncbi:hypothetical protein ACOMHN_004468 [Nucella lapillus]